MLITASVSIPVETRELIPVVRGLFDLVEQHATDLEHIGIHATLGAMRDFAFIRSLAAELPAETLGFTFSGLGGPRRLLTAREFLEQVDDVKVVRFSVKGDPVEMIRELIGGGSAAMAGYRGNLTECLSYSDAKHLIMRLLESTPGAARNAMVGFSLNQVAWNGLPPDYTGTADLWDAWSRSKVRFRMNASLECKAASAKDATVRRVVQQVADRTGLPFDPNKVYTRPDPADFDGSTLEALFPIEVAFQEAVAQASADVGALNLRWRGLPGIFDGMSERGSPAQAGVPLPDLKPNAFVRAWFKESFPGWKSVTPGRDDWLRFRKPLGERLNFTLSFEYDRILKKRGFTPVFGIEVRDGALQGWRWTVPAFRLLGRTLWMPYWRFHTLEELTGALPSIAELLHCVQPILETDLRQWLSPLPAEVDAVVLQRGAVTAREVYEEALMYAQLWCRDAKLNGATAGCRYIGALTSPNWMAVVNSTGSGVDADGRLTRHGYWAFDFAGPHRETYCVTIPNIGSPQCGAHFTPQWASEPLDEDWIDSDEAIRMADVHGGSDARREATTCSPPRCFLTTYTRSVPKPHWNVEYMMSSERGRKDFHVSIDAYTGEPLRIPRG